MSYNPCCFDRHEYLAYEDIFEPLELTDASQELSAFNGDATSLAFELAYTRYRVAKLEAQLAEALKQVPKIMKLYSEDCRPTAAGWYWIADSDYDPVPAYYNGTGWYEGWYESECEVIPLSDPQFWLEMELPTIPEGEA